MPHVVPGFRDFTKTRKTSSWFYIFLDKINAFQLHTFSMGFAFWGLMSFAHHWHLFGFLGSNFWWVCSILCTLMTLVCAYPIYKDFSRDLLRLGFSMTVGFTGICLTLGGFGVGNVLFSFGLNSLFRSIFGHMDDSQKDWVKAQQLMIGLQIVLYGLVALCGLGSIYWSLVTLASTAYLFYDRPSEYAGAGMVAASFLSAYFSWLLSTAVVMFPFIMSQYGIHVFYHDALLTMSAIGLGQFLKQSSNKADAIFPHLMIIRNGVVKQVSQYQLKIGDYVLLEKEQCYLPGLSFKVKELSENSLGINRQREEGDEKIKIDDYVCYAPQESQFEKWSKGKAVAVVVSEVDREVRIQLDPGQSVMKYFVPGVILISMLAFLGWASVGMHAQAVSALINTLLIACPCTFTIALPLLEQKAKESFSNSLTCCSKKYVRMHNLDRIRHTQLDTLVVDRSHTIVDQSSGEGVWRMSDQQINSLVSLVKATRVKNVLILSGHSEEGAEAAMRNDVNTVMMKLNEMKRQNPVNVRVWMDKRFNSSLEERASHLKGRVIDCLKLNAIPLCCPNMFEKSKEAVLSSQYKPLKASSSRLRIGMVGDGRNDIDALKRADMSIHVGDDLGVLAQSHAALTVTEFSKLSDNVLRSFISVVSRYKGYAFHFKLAAFTFNLCAISLTIGGWYALLGVSMPCGLGCIAMAAFSFVLSVLANDFVFSVANPTKSHSKGGVLDGYSIFRGLGKLVSGVSKALSKNEGPQAKNSQQSKGPCCG